MSFFKNRPEFILWLKARWNLDFQCARHDIEIQGSPERVLERIVIQDKNENLFLLEKFHKDQYELKNCIARAVEYLNNNGLSQAHMYNKTDDNSFCAFFEDNFFQISRFLYSTGIKRPDYLKSTGKGENFAQFIQALFQASHKIADYVQLQKFSLKNYIYRLFNDMKRNDISVYNNFLPFLEFLETKFMDVHDNLPLWFCHGDLHPLNIIWDNDTIKAVIDWEFTGFKPDIYDAANLVGCAGIENPEGLGMPFVMTFLNKLKADSNISETGWQFFPEYVLALRFAWLAEWLRREDKDMLEMEQAYMAVLVDNIDIIKQGWEL